MSAFGCQLTMVPDKGIACVLMLNRLPRRAGQIVFSLLDKLLGLPGLTSFSHIIPPDTSLWPNYVGTYLGNRTGLAVISIVKGQFQLELNGQRIPLEAQRAGLYTGRRPESESIVSVGFVPEATGPSQYIMFLSARLEQVYQCSYSDARWRSSCNCNRLTTRSSHGSISPCRTNNLPPSASSLMPSPHKPGAFAYAAENGAAGHLCMLCAEAEPAFV